MYRLLVLWGMWNTALGDMLSNVLGPMVGGVVALMYISVRLLQPSNALSPIVVTELGKINVVIPQRFLKAAAGITVTLSPIFKVLISSHPSNTDMPK